jgi:hypothetical protein
LALHQAFNGCISQWHLHHLASLHPFPVGLPWRAHFITCAGISPNGVPFGDQILETSVVGERSILSCFQLAKNDLVQWLGCWSQMQPLAIIMFLDESWRHSHGFAIIAADDHLGCDFHIRACMWSRWLQVQRQIVAMPYVAKHACLMVAHAMPCGCKIAEAVSLEMPCGKNV